jgi:hypothetical protein
MEVIAKSGLVFELVGEEPYQRKDGSMTELRVWRSGCKVCGEAFEAKTPAYAEKYEDSSSFRALHCVKHKLTKEQVTQRLVAAKAK